MPPTKRNDLRFPAPKVLADLLAVGVAATSTMFPI
jgi:hypothetical protein